MQPGRFSSAALQASLAPHYRPSDQAAGRESRGRMLRVAGALCILIIVIVVAAVVFLVKPQASSEHLRKSSAEEAELHQEPHSQSVHRTEAPSTSTKHKSFEHTTAQAEQHAPVEVQTTEAPSKHKSSDTTSQVRHVHSTSTKPRKVTTEDIAGEHPKEEQRAFVEAMQPFLEPEKAADELLIATHDGGHLGRPGDHVASPAARAIERGRGPKGGAGCREQFNMFALHKDDRN
eukprot:Skav220835  [mRNA]  locus=scaffold1888:155434:164304:+ [translate_table: standard]